MKRWVKVSYTVMKLNLKIVYVQDRKTDWTTSSEIGGDEKCNVLKSLIRDAKKLTSNIL